MIYSMGRKMENSLKRVEGKVDKKMKIMEKIMNEEMNKIRKELEDVRKQAGSASSS